MLERAQNHIFWRRLSYFLLLAITLCLVFLPQFWPPIPGVDIPKETTLPEWIPDLPYWIYEKIVWVLLALERLYTWVFGIVKPFIPPFTYYWFDGWAQSPFLFTFLIAFMIIFYRWSNWIVANTQRIAEAGWWHMKGLNPTNRYRLRPKSFECLACWLRSKPSYQCFRQIFVKLLVPAAFIVICLGLIAGAAYRILIHQPYVSEGVCSLDGATQMNKNANEFKNEGAVVIKFDTRTPCHDTGFKIELGRKYTVEVLQDWQWKDHETPARIGGLYNLLHNFKPAFLIGLPARRHIAKPWFVLLGEIGAGSGHVIPFNRENFTFTAAARGTLYIYVNDAINPAAAVKNSFLPDWVEEYFNDDWDAFYKNNSGKAEITITPFD